MELVEHDGMLQGGGAWDMHAFDVVGIYRKQYPESTASTFGICFFKKTGEGGVRKI